MTVKRFALLVCIMTFLAFSGGCATPAGRSAGEVIDDVAITSKINALIVQDTDLKFLKIDVDTFKGNVTLRGAVSSGEAEGKLIRLSRDVRGVKDVTSRLRIELGK
ncbi:MAG: BON domain-containing protein [Deltaproteobacteria bacterium]|nr:BON domain-containing protein [Deltaproteobacteria bacterium]